MVHRAPWSFGLARSRWRLVDLRQVLGWAGVSSVSGWQRLLARLRIRWKRGRAWVHSPDPDYDAKLAAIAGAQALTRAEPATYRLLFQDEVTLSRHPTVSHAYAAQGHDQARARRSHAADTLTRLTATLDAASGQVVARRASRITLATHVAFLRALVDTYAQHAQLFLVVDNWPLHFHPDVLVALEPQLPHFPRYVPPTWPSDPSPEARRRWGDLHLPIQLLPLPTYASWCNPIEQLWRQLRQDLTHFHPWADDLPALRQQLDAFLAQFAHGSADLLRYVGLQALNLAG